MHGPASKHVQVQMVNGLTSIVSAVDNGAEALAQTFLLRYFG